MKLPILEGIIDRRILVNYRVQPDIVRKLLPPDFEPLIVNGYASAGICLLRLKNIGPKWLPSMMRINSENAAHRFLVTHKLAKKEVPGVFIPRRDTDSMLNVTLAGKVLSWPHYHAKFEVRESGDSYSVELLSGDGQTQLDLEAKTVATFPGNSMFDSIEHASRCFQQCAIGFSPSTVAGRRKIIELKTKSWTVTPLRISYLRSSFFDNHDLFPEETIQFDNALLMRGIEHEWRTPEGV